MKTNKVCSKESDSANVFVKIKNNFDLMAGPRNCELKYPEHMYQTSKTIVGDCYFELCEQLSFIPIAQYLADQDPL